MGWLSNVRMAYKILCLVLAAAIGLAAVSFNGYLSLHAAENTVDTMSTVYMPASKYLAEDQLNLRKVQAAMLEAIATPNPERREKMKKDLVEKYDVDFNTSWQAYSELMQDNETVAPKLADTRANWEAYKAVALQVIELAIANRVDEASQLYGSDGIKKLNALKNSLNELQEIGDAAVKAADEANEAEASAANTRMIVISLVAFVLLFVAANYIIREITTALKQMISVCSRLQQGDFRDDGINFQRQDELGEMWTALQNVRSNLHGLMDKFNNTAQQLAAASEELTASSQQSAEASAQVAQSVMDAAEAASNQQESVNRSNEAVSGVAATVENIQQNSAQVAGNSMEASAKAKNGMAAVDTAVLQMQEVESTVQESAVIVDQLGTSSQEIGQIVDTITAITSQTNLLALNAAIEAARAGEAGRGFAVVADEVRKLAEQSQESAQRIAALIGDIQKNTDNAVRSMQAGRERVVAGAESVEGLKENFSEIVALIDGMAREIKEISEAIRGVAGDTREITAAVDQLSHHSSNIADEMQTVSATTEQQTASAQNIAQASDSLANLAQELQLAIQVFKL